MSKRYFIYILTNKNHTVLYTGFTDDLAKRILGHRSKIFKGFTQKYNIVKLLYYEEYSDKGVALYREQQLKRYRRKWKENLIDSMNPEWRDLAEDFDLEL